MRYDAVVCAGPHHLKIAAIAIRSMLVFSEPDRILVITSTSNFDVFRQFEAQGIPVEVIDEDALMHGVTLSSLTDYFTNRGADPARAGWYFQQFLKMAVCSLPGLADHYLIWDSDTVMLRPLSFFDRDGKTLVNPTEKYNPSYFEVMERLLGFSRLVDFSFISEHLMIKKDYMRDLIEQTQAKDGDRHWTKIILDIIGDDNLSRMGFSEFETYGNYVHLNHRDSCVVRKLRSLRSGAKKAGNIPGIRDLVCFSRKYAYVSFEVWTRPNRWKHVLWIFESGIYRAIFSLVGLVSRRKAEKQRSFSKIAP